MSELSLNDVLPTKDELSNICIDQQSTSSDAVEDSLNEKQTPKKSLWKRKIGADIDLSSKPLCERILRNPSLTIYQAQEKENANKGLLKKKQAKSSRSNSQTSSLQNDDLPPSGDQLPILMLDESGNIVVSNPSQYERKAEVKTPTASTTTTTTSKSFRQNHRPSNNWNKEDTAFFYEALEKVGTDFSLMEELYFKNRGRDRKHLKQKFKREEKVNRQFIDAIIYKFLNSRIHPV